MDADGVAMLSIELEPQMKITEDTYSQTVRLNIASLPFLDSCLAKSFMKIPEIPIHDSSLQDSACQCKMVLLPSTDSLLSLLSLSKTPVESHSGVPNLFFVPVSEHSSQKTCLRHGYCSSSGCVPDGGDASQSPQPVPPPFSHGQIQPQCHAAHPSQLKTLVEGEVEPVVGCHPLAPSPAWGATTNSEQPLSKAVMENVMKLPLSRQEGLLLEAEKLQKRLQSLLGEHASLHCSQQLAVFKKLHRTRVTAFDSKPHWSHQCPRGSRPQYCTAQTSTVRLSSAELQEFGGSCWEIPGDPQDALDSDATASSSSGEETDEENCQYGAKPLPTCSGRDAVGSSEGTWLQERAEVGSRWSWLLLRLAELEGKIQQLGELHKHIRSTKASLVLAEPQPLMDRQIQQALLRATAGLSYTAGHKGGELLSDADSELSSPTHLLYNIERQSAQLVNSLMPPLNLSPFSSPLPKQPHAQKGIGKRPFSSGHRGDEAFSLRGSKRKKAGGGTRQQLLRVDVTCVCARTRPLVMYHKPRLFNLHTHSTSNTGTGGRQDLDSNIAPPHPSSTLSSTCPTCSPCDPSALCSDPTCTSSSPLTSRKLHSRLHPVLSVSSDTPLSHHLQKALGREEWSLRPLLGSANVFNPGHYNRLYRRTVPQPNNEEDFRRQLSELGESSEDLQDRAYTPTASCMCKQASEGCVRHRQGESVHRINDVVVPVSPAAAVEVEKQPCKDILTPRWRVINIQSLKDGEVVEEKELEVLTDEAFKQRHLAYEQREKLRWTPWGGSHRYRRSTRSGSRWSGSRWSGSRWSGGLRRVCVALEWSCSQLDSLEKPGSDVWLPCRAPWGKRVFPLGGEEEEALHADDLHSRALLRWPEGETTTEIGTDTTRAINPNSNSFSYTVSSCSTSPPSAGQSRDDAASCR
ncbi:KAT8 regulatory NSL complex subunit 1-like protein [Lampris incognitus]|uniref:KAT8 regulatory NSL complex subunit 1-like protein n=1 Tax=Lampris incognitus TaxID=2546036 RepID=UPI0024B593FF|nr:KAT8 regulatory NSL complex subunit 1-like protein [Lampris incognitus]